MNNISNTLMFVITTLLVVLTLILLVWAIIDISKNKRNKSIIFFLLFSPIIGPIIYFQTKKGHQGYETPK